MPYTAPWVQPVYPSTALPYTSGSRHLSCCFSEIPMTFWPQDLCTSSPCLWPDSIYYVFVSLLPRLLDWKLHECIYVCTCACVYVKHSLPYTQYLGQWLACRRCSVEDLPRARLSQQRACSWVPAICLVRGLLPFCLSSSHSASGWSAHLAVVYPGKGHDSLGNRNLKYPSL